jgi:hypothetical protein
LGTGIEVIFAIVEVIVKYSAAVRLSINAVLKANALFGRAPPVVV